MQFLMGNPNPFLNLKRHVPLKGYRGTIDFFSKFFRIFNSLWRCIGSSMYDGSRLGVYSYAVFEAESESILRLETSCSDEKLLRKH